MFYVVYITHKHIAEKLVQSTCDILTSARNPDAGV